MRLLGWLILTAVMVIALNFSMVAVYARGGNSAGPGSGQCLLKNQSLHQTGRLNLKNKSVQRTGSGSADRKRLRDGSCVNPS
jgi:hypothetical protein